MKKSLCPICSREMAGVVTEWPEFPFCSPRCRKIDLGRWLGENYKVSRPPAADENRSSEDEE